MREAIHQGAFFGNTAHLHRNNLLLLSRHSSSCINQIFSALSMSQPLLNAEREAGAAVVLCILFGWVDWENCSDQSRENALSLKRKSGQWQ